MEHRQLGHSGLEVSQIGLGCGNFGGIGSAPEFFGTGESEEEAFALMDTAWDLGIRLFDTADAYGGGRSEAAIAKWLRTRGSRVRDELVLTTKVFNPMAAGADWGLSRGRILRQIDSSLRRLGVDRVDLYLAHEPDPDTPLEETLGTFDELVRAGKIRAYGVSNFDAAHLEGALRAGRPECVQNSYSLLDRGDAEDVLPLCAERGLGYAAFSPLAGGWLTGKYRRGEPPPPGSRMTTRPEPYQHLVSEPVFDALDAFRVRAEERRVSTAALALAWLLADPRVSAVISGPRRAEHLEPVRQALELDLSPGEREELVRLFP